MTLAHKTGLAALTALLMVAALLLPPTSASASDAVDEAVVSIVGTAHLSGGVTSPPGTPGCLGGLAVGAGTAAGGPGAVLAAGSPAGASFTYSNNLVSGEAQGNLWVQGLHIPSVGAVDVNADFDWTRIGATAVVFLQGNNEAGLAVAALLPTHLAADLDLFACDGEKKGGGNISHGSWAGEEHVQIAGVGVISTQCPCP